MFTVTPYIPAAGQRYIEARRKGMLLEDAEGRPAIIRLPSGYYACLDVTLPEVTAYFGELLDNLRKEGITHSVSTATVPSTSCLPESARNAI